MLLCDIVLADTIPLATLASPNFYRNVIRWAFDHGASVEGLLQDMGTRKSIYAQGSYNVRLKDCLINADELDSRGMLCIADFDAYITNFRNVSGNAENPIQVMLTEFFDKLFEDNNFSEEERNAVLNMSLKQFIGAWKMENPVEAASGDEPSTARLQHDNTYQLNVPKSFLISWPLEVICPNCHNKGSIKIIDGNIKCIKCHASFGDIDNMKE